MRSIKFRGLRTDGKGWETGSITIDNHGKCLIRWFSGGDYNIPFATEVLPPSVGQFTGLTDKNGKEIYEGDCLHSTGYLCKVSWADGCFRTVYEHPEDGEILILGEDIDVSEMEVIGNIHEESEVHNA